MGHWRQCRGEATMKEQDNGSSSGGSMIDTGSVVRLFRCNLR